MTHAPAQQINIARHIARSAQRQIENKTGMRIAIMLRQGENAKTPEEMLKVIAMALSMNADCYRMKTRIRDIVEMRFIGALLLRMHFPRFTLSQIALLFGGQDHTSILSGIARAHNLIYTHDVGFTEKYSIALKTVNAWMNNEAPGYELAISA
jgi:chromosomal replication initiation ATPase DnaA